MASEVYTTVKGCSECAYHRVNRTKTHHLEIFPAGSRLELTGMDFIGSLQKETKGHQFVVVMNGLYSKLT